MPSLRFEKSLILASLFAVLIIVICSDWLIEIASVMSSNPKWVVWGLVGTLVTAAFGLSLKIILATADAKTQVFQMQLRQVFDTGVTEIKRDLFEVKEDLSDMRCAQIRSDDRLARVECAVGQITNSMDEKKRRWNEWDQYWNDIKGDSSRYGTTMSIRRRASSRT